MDADNLKALILPPGQGRVYNHLGGEKITVLLSAGDTGGTFAMIIDDCPPGGGPPLHIHHNEDETFYILEGELTMQVNEEIFSASAGTSVFLPKGIPHTFRNFGSQRTKSLALLSPAGLEGFFEEVEPLLTEGEPDMTAVLEIAGRYGIEAVGPPIEEPVIP